jgi:cyclopropane fatty-acyl-phospholipid synthase-like methyltransferase
MTAVQNPQAMWDQRYLGHNFLFGEAPNHYLTCQQAHLKPGNALAIADGEGRNSVWLAKQGLQVDAFDFSPNALIKAKQWAQRNAAEVNFVCSDWQSFDWKPAHYDNIVGVFFQFAGPQDRAQIFKHIDASLKPGGVLLIQGYTPAQLKFNTGGPGKMDHLYDASMLHAAFLGYHVLDMQTYEAEIQEGTAHCGPSGLIGYVAQKPF